MARVPRGQRQCDGIECTCLGHLSRDAGVLGGGRVAALAAAAGGRRLEWVWFAQKGERRPHILRAAPLIITCCEGTEPTAAALAAPLERGERWRAVSGREVVLARAMGGKSSESAARSSVLAGEVSLSSAALAAACVPGDACE